MRWKILEPEVAGVDVVDGGGRRVGRFVRLEDARLAVQALASHEPLKLAVQELLDAFSGDGGGGPDLDYVERAKAALEGAGPTYVPRPERQPNFPPPQMAAISSSRVGSGD